MSEVVNPLWNLINELSVKKGINEIVVNGPKSIFVEKDGEFVQIQGAVTKDQAIQFIQEIAAFNKKNCDDKNPIMDGNLPDGSRINVIREPYAKDFPAITIRKYSKSIRTFENSPLIFSLSKPWVEFLRALVKARVNIVVSGGTGVGKTTFMNLLLAEVPVSERIVTIEDTIELHLNQPNLVRMEMLGQSSKQSAGLKMRDLVKNTLRMRPDRIIIGEVRGEELFELLQAMNTGHDGSMTSIHANSAGECVQRMETLFLMSGFEMPNIVVKKQISTAVDFIIQLGRTREGLRTISHISEITGMEGPVIQMQTLANFEDGKLKYSGLAPRRWAKISEMSGLALDFLGKELS